MPADGSPRDDFGRSDAIGAWSAQRLHYQFNDPQLLDLALTHRSASSQHNERLEFLGDAILSFVVTEALYQRFPTTREGDLTRLRSKIVSGQSLAGMAREIELGCRLQLGSGEQRSGGRERDSILADALEALIGAVFLDGGLEPSRGMVLTLFADRLDETAPDQELKDPKTRLQEALQARRLPLPVYTVVETTGEPHLQQFTVRCDIASLSPVHGIGTSRRRAEQDVALKALEMLENG